MTHCTTLFCGTMGTQNTSENAKTGADPFTGDVRDAELVSWQVCMISCTPWQASDEIHTNLLALSGKSLDGKCQAQLVSSKRMAICTLFSRSSFCNVLFSLMPSTSSWTPCSESHALFHHSTVAAMHSFRASASFLISEHRGRFRFGKTLTCMVTYSITKCIIA